MDMNENEIKLYDIVVLDDGRRGFVADIDVTFKRLNGTFEERRTYTIDAGGELIKIADVSLLSGTGISVAPFAWGHRVKIRPHTKSAIDVLRLKGTVALVTGIGYDPALRIWSFSVQVDNTTYCFAENELEAFD